MKSDSKENIISLPLVSVIITNYNYASYLLDAVNSVLTQTYPHIECIIVDDASTDQSIDVIDEIERCYCAVKIIRKKTNEGQTAAFRSGFEASSGEYVVFLDADDILVAGFVETHIFTHLSLRVPVGFTSSDMFQTRESRIVNTSLALIGEFVSSGRGYAQNSLRRVDKSAPDLWTIKGELPEDIENRVHLFGPNKWREWVFSPTSGNCYRRDALDLFLGFGAVVELKYHGDTYLNRGVSLLCGAAIIDIPLSIYRIHGQNGFCGHPDLQGICSGALEKEFRSEYFAWRAVVDRLIDYADIFLHKLDFDRYVWMLTILQKEFPSRQVFSQYESLEPYLEQKLLLKAREIESLVGPENFALLLGRVKSTREACDCNKRGGPRPWLRHVSEFLFTMGRVLGSKHLTYLGERTWNF